MPLTVPMRRRPRMREQIRTQSPLNVDCNLAKVTGFLIHLHSFVPRGVHWMVICVYFVWFVLCSLHPLASYVTLFPRAE